MTIWLVEPHDPLIAREGRPFGPDAGASATTLPFPFPSTLAGGVRSRSAIDENGLFQYERDDQMSPEALRVRQEHLEELKAIRIRGPLLVQLPNESNDLAPNDAAWLVPMPNDAQLFASDPNEPVLLRRLVPLTLPSDAQTDFAQKERGKQLLLVGPESVDPSRPRKPPDHYLRYWHWKHFQTWLFDPTSLAKRDDLPLSSLGYGDLVRDYRLHVSMDSEREMGKDGMLFGTSGLEFTHPGEKEQRLYGARRLALALDVEDTDHGTTPLAGVASLAGERRIVTWRQSTQHFPTCPDSIKDAIKRDGHCRLVLLTPASFTEGYYPEWLPTTHAQAWGVTVKPLSDRRAPSPGGFRLGSRGRQAQTVTASGSGGHGLLPLCARRRGGGIGRLD